MRTMGGIWRSRMTKEGGEQRNASKWSRDDSEARDSRWSA